MLLILQHQHVHGQLLLGGSSEFLVSQGEDELQVLPSAAREAGSLPLTRSKGTLRTASCVTLDPFHDPLLTGGPQARAKLPIIPPPNPDPNLSSNACLLMVVDP